MKNKDNKIKTLLLIASLVLSIETAYALSYSDSGSGGTDSAGNTCSTWTYHINVYPDMKLVLDSNGSTLSNGSTICAGGTFTYLQGPDTGEWDSSCYVDSSTDGCPAILWVGTASCNNHCKNCYSGSASGWASVAYHTATCEGNDLDGNTYYYACGYWDSTGACKSTNSMTASGPVASLGGGRYQATGTGDIVFKAAYSAHCRICGMPGASFLDGNGFISLKDLGSKSITRTLHVKQCTTTTLATTTTTTTTVDTTTTTIVWWIDLRVSDVHQGNRSNTGRNVTYRVWYDGNVNARNSTSNLSIDGVFIMEAPVGAHKFSDPLPYSLENFSYVWNCSGTSDFITVCADSRNVVHESDETNNCNNATWYCNAITTTTSTTKASSTTTSTTTTASTTTTTTLQKTVTLKYRVTDDQSAVMTCSVWSDFSGSWAIYATNNNVPNNTVTSFNVPAIGLGAHRWNVVCKDDADLSAWAPLNWSFRVG